MSLPSIIEVAELANVAINPRTYGKKEVYAECPFCHARDQRRGKFKLSMNTHFNIYKCWICNESGGVLDFESRLTGIPFHEVRAKYFGEETKPKHPAERLNPRQLKLIGWDEYKRQNHDYFKTNRDSVLNDWNAYKHDEYVKHFAMFMVTAHLENQKKRQDDLLLYIMQSCKNTQIYMMFNHLLSEFVKDDDLRADWAKEGVEIARSAWKVALETFDFDLNKVMLNVVTLYYMQKMYSQNDINDDLNQKRSS